MRGLTVTKVAAVAGSVTLLTTGCLSSGSSSSDAGGGSTSGGAKKTVQIMFGFGGDQTQGFKDSLDPWAKQNGIKIDYVQASSFDTLIRSKVAGNAAPDIALFPQPGLLQDIAGQKKLQPLDDVLDMAKLKASIGPAAHGRRPRWTASTYGVPVSIEHQEPARVRTKPTSKKARRLPDPPRPSTSWWRSPTRSGRRAPRRGASASSPVRRPAGRAPTGSRTSSSEQAGPDGLRQVGQPRA